MFNDTEYDDDITAIGKTTNVQTAGREGWFWYCFFNFFVYQHWFLHVLLISMCTNEKPSPTVKSEAGNPRLGLQSESELQLHRR